MTTPAAEALYLAQHNLAHEDKGYAIFNPKGLSVDALPFIYGFNNGGSPNWYSGVLLAQDGKYLGGHICSDEGYMRADLGIITGTRDDRHKTFREHYPNGYRMDFISYNDLKDHVGINEALKLNKDMTE